MWIKKDLVMLPTKKSNMCRIIDLEDNTFKFYIQPNQDAFIDTVDKGFHVERFHLYILSDEEIKEGDWKYNEKLNCITQHLREGKGFPNEFKKAASWCKKIIATTDSSLMITDYVDCDYPLPYIPQSFIKYFVSEYNKGNIITKVMVEYEECKMCKGTKKHIVAMFGEVDCNYCDKNEGYEKLYIEPTLKINPDNTINIKPIKESWNREEVIELIKKCYCDAEISNYEDNVNKWIEENI